MKLPKINNRLLGLATLTLAAAASIMLAANCTEAKSPFAVIGKDNVVKLEVAQSEQEITRGLMFRTSMPEDAGMVFLFDPPRPVNFWMYHTLIPLDMLFIKNGKIVKLFENVPPCKSENPRECPTYPSNEAGPTVTEVVEVNGNWCQRHGIKEGDPVRFTLVPPAKAAAQ